VDRGGPGRGRSSLGKAKFLLAQSEKNGGDDPRAGEAGRFICYKAKCAGDAPPVRQFTDQFQTHSLRVTKSQLVCVPATHVCGDGILDPPEQCDGNDAAACPGTCRADCTCPNACQATTGGFCWFNGQSGASCDAVCAAVGRVYDAATETFAGSGGTDANCQAVLADLSIQSQMFTGGESCLSFGLGCCYANTGTLPSFRCATPATTSSASSSLSRICACQ
jgi:hypothetical protein